MKNKHILLLFVLLSFVILFNSCRVLRPTEMFQTDEEYPVTSFESSKKEYVIQPYDKIAL